MVGEIIGQGAAGWRLSVGTDPRSARPLPAPKAPFYGQQISAPTRNSLNGFDGVVFGPTAFVRIVEKAAKTRPASSSYLPSSSDTSLASRRTQARIPTPAMTNDRKPAHAISPVALAAVTRMDAPFAIERDITGPAAEARRETRQRLSRPLVEDLHRWLLGERSQMYRHNPVAKAIDYMFEKPGRWEAFTRFLDDGRICMTNNAAERAPRGVALGRKAWLFAGSERGGDRAAFMYTLIVTAKLNDIDPQAWLANILARMPNMPVSRLPELLPWNWAAERNRQRDAA